MTEPVREQYEGAQTSMENAIINNPESANRQRNMSANKQRPRNSKSFSIKSQLIPIVLSTVCIILSYAHSQVAESEDESNTAEALPSTTSPTSTPSLELNTTDNDIQSVNNTINKLKPVNFTLVDEIFEATISEQEVVKKWRQMDSQLQDGMKSILKMIFPQIVAISQDAKVSGDCSGGILKWILSLRNLRSWAIKSKPTAGMFEGSLTMFGNYRQCLSIRAPDEDEIEITDQFEEYFRGQFCVLHLKPWMPIKKPFYHLNSTIKSLTRSNHKYYEKTLYDELAEIAIAFNFIDIRMDLCIPSTCTLSDIQRVADLLSKKLEMRAKVIRCDIASREKGILNQLDAISYYWLALPLILICLSLICTILANLKFDGFPKRELNLGQSNNPRVQPMFRRKLVTLFECLSISHSFRDRLKRPGSFMGVAFNDEEEAPRSEHWSQQQHWSENQLKPLPLYGLRSLFVLWFIVVQMTVELNYQYLRESLALRDMIISYWPFQIIVNSSILFESLIVITAFTYSYTCIESSFKNTINYIMDKYIRLVLSIITVIALTIVTPFIEIESPVWRNFVGQQSTLCKSTGFLNLFFLQNFISYDKICLPHTWLFCVEMQLIALSIPLIVLYKKTFISIEDSIIISRVKDLNNKDDAYIFTIIFFKSFSSKAGLLSLLFVTAGVITNFSIVYTNQLPPSWFYTFPDASQKNYYFTHYLTKTWTHLCAFMIGLIGGHLCRSTIQLRKIIHLKASQHPSPAPSSIQGSRVHGSTSTIMAIDLTNQRIDNDNSHQSTGCNNTEHTMLKISSQIAALIFMLAIIFSTFTWSTQETPSTLIAATYDAASRIIWSISLVGLMIHMCLAKLETNKYSSAAQLLSHPICILVGRLSFLAYLISPYINNFVLAVEEQSLFPSLFIVFHVIVGNIVITYVMAFVLAIVIEQPLRRLISRFVLGQTFSKHKINISTFYTSETESIPNFSMQSK